MHVPAPCVVNILKGDPRVNYPQIKYGRGHHWRDDHYPLAMLSAAIGHLQVPGKVSLATCVHFCRYLKIEFPSLRQGGYSQFSKCRLAFQLLEYSVWLLTNPL